MTNNIKDRVIGGLLATVGVLSYVGIVKPLAQPTYSDAPTCWIEKVKVGTEMELQAYCGDAGESHKGNGMFVRWVTVVPNKNERLNQQ